MIIKNCPAFDSKYNECHSKIEPHKLYCQDCTDCLLKKIVEKCREDEKPIILDVHEEAKDGMIVGRMLLKKEILDMLDIEEVE